MEAVSKYQRFMSKNPYKFGVFTNSLGQIIDFYEHPTRGDEAPIICVCHELQLVQSSNFFDLEDMQDLGGDYEAIFKDGKLICGFEMRG